MLTQMSIIISLIMCLKTQSVMDLPVKKIPSAYRDSPAQMVSGTLKITVQPSDQSDCKGNKVTFSVVAEGGNGLIHYNWKRKRSGDTDFTSFGARDSVKLPIYTIGTGNEAPDQTQYQVTITDSETNVTSGVASLFVNQIAGIAPIGIATYTLKEGDNLALNVLTSGNIPLSFQWIKKYGSNDWRDLTDNSAVKGSQSAQLKLTKISVADSGLYKVRVTFPTIDSNKCTETSSISRRIYVSHVEDNDPPLFINLTSKSLSLCPEDLEQANWIETISDILPVRKNIYQLHKYSQLFDLSTDNFSDNLTPSEVLILHWGITVLSNPFTTLKDNTGILLDNKTGQISRYPEDIDFENPIDENLSYQIIYWLEDAAGNLTPDAQRHKITVQIPIRPEIISLF